MKKFAGVLALLGLLFSLSGCLGAPDKEERIRIGLVESLSGLDQETGQEVLRGVQLAHQDRGRVLGRPVDLITYDTRGLAYEAATGVTHLTQVAPKVHALIGPQDSQASLEAALIVERVGIPALSGASSSAQIKNTDFYHMLAMDDRDQARAMALFAVDQLNLSHIAICIDEESANGPVFAQAFKEALPAYVKTYDLNYHTGETHFPFIVDQVKRLPVEGVYCPGNLEVTSLLVKEIKSSLPSLVLMGADPWDHENFYALTEGAGQGAYFTSQFAHQKLTTESGGRFYQAYQRAYGQDPTSFAALGYDAYMVLWEALDRAETTDPHAIQRELVRMRDFYGVVGHLDLSPQKDQQKLEILVQGEDASHWKETVTLTNEIK
ncbi:MAG: ABC transporter substrate-binding protein [Tissierellia bacterium]|nr:ABC transporter substrate-binding protein [Tissierellia bacterium]